MRALRVVFAALVAAALVPAGCLVSSFEKVDALDDDDGSVGGGGSGGSVGGAAGGGAAGSGGGLSCNGGECAPGPKGDPGCCFTTPEFSEVCGLAVPDYGNVCLPLAGQGALNAACPVHSIPAGELQGCCMPGGLCGLHDTNDHGLGCMPTENFNGASQAPCGSDPCGEYCIAAATNACGLAGSQHLFPAYACTQNCKALGCNTEIAAFLSGSCALTSGCTDTADGHPYFANCPSENLAVAECLEKIECGRYCKMVADKCAATTPQFKDEPQCEEFCKEWLKGDFTVTFPAIQNSIYCRMDFAASEDCAAAGPVGQGAAPAALCDQGARQTYCELYKLRCPTEFATDWPTPCVSGAASIPVKGGFSIGSNAGNTIECRIEALLGKSCADARKTPAPGSPCAT